VRRWPAPPQPPIASAADRGWQIVSYAPDASHEDTKTRKLGHGATETRTEIIADYITASPTRRIVTSFKKPATKT
jgi:hypothetical protein